MSTWRLSILRDMPSLVPRFRTLHPNSDNSQHHIQDERNSTEQKQNSLPRQDADISAKIHPDLSALSASVEALYDFPPQECHQPLQPHSGASIRPRKKRSSKNTENKENIHPEGNKSRASLSLKIETLENGMLFLTLSFLGIDRIRKFWINRRNNKAKISHW